MIKRYSALLKEISNIKFMLILLPVIILFTTVSAKPKELIAKYNIQMLGANIGEFSVIQTSENENMNIEAITDVKVNLLFSYRVKYVQNTVYNNGILQKSEVKTYKNGKLNSNMWMNFENGVYRLVSDGDTTFFHDSITYSGSLIYFNEPREIKNIYKERSKEVRQISPVSEHEYIITDKKGRELNRYYYTNGVLQYAKMRHTLGTLELKRVNQ